MLETERTFLRTFTEKDLRILSELHFDDLAMGQIIGGRRTSEYQVTQDLHEYMSGQEKHGYSQWAVQSRLDGSFVGRAGFVLIEESDEIEMALVLSPRHWSNGYATEITSALIAWADDKLPLEKIIAVTTPQNKSAQRVLEKIGMRFDRAISHFHMEFKVYRLVARPEPPGDQQRLAQPRH